VSNIKGGWAVFVHGCFWHSHPGCDRATIPRNNRSWWEEKLAANRERDSRKIRDLEHLGLRVIVIWECQTKDRQALESILASALIRPG